MNNTEFKKKIQRIVFGKAIRGEPIRNKPKKHTTMPVEGISLLQWYRGEWIHHINIKK